MSDLLLQNVTIRFQFNALNSQTGHVHWMEVGDGNKNVKLITRAMNPLIFGTEFAVIFFVLYILFYIVELL